MSLREAAVAKAQNWMSSVPNIEWRVDGNPRQATAAALQHLSVEHHSGIVCLLSNLQDSPAFALVRAQWETFVRGLWIRSIADERQLALFFKSSEIDVNMRQMITGVQDAERREHLLGVHKRVWKLANDWTHGGMLQIRARSQVDSIETAFGEEDIERLVLLSTGISFQSLIEISLIVGDATLERQLADTYAAVFFDSKPPS